MTSNASIVMDYKPRLFWLLSLHSLIGTLLRANVLKAWSGLRDNPMKIRNQLLLASIVLTFSVGSATAQHTYSKAVQKACANDYHSHCGQYGIETEALRLCMDKAGQALSKTCVDALVDAGEVSKAEVERRKRTGRWHDEATGMALTKSEARTSRLIFYAAAIVAVLYGLLFLSLPEWALQLSQDPGAPKDAGWLRWSGAFLIGIALAAWLAATQVACGRYVL
jgi:uncharacterized protein YjeT (DUF2065 family)